MSKREELKAIIKNERVTPVFQPIINLRNGSVHGYEALSRMTEPMEIKNTEELFNLAGVCGRIWALERVCRKKILQKYSEFTQPEQTGKLFINVNPLVMTDENFKARFTRKHLDKYGISPECIVIEITERSMVANQNEFLSAVAHYKKQGYQIAIDDVGACYSGLNVVCDTHPHYLKIDMPIIRNIDKDQMKYAMVKGLAEFSRHASVMLIAEGIETEEELQTLLELGVDYGQGYFIGKPAGTIGLDRSSYQHVLDDFYRHSSDGEQLWDGKAYRPMTFVFDSDKAFFAFSDKYGDQKADAVLRMFYNTVKKVLRDSEKMFMLDEMKCMALIEKGRCHDVSEQICSLFQDDVACFYDKQDLDRGYIEKINKKGVLKRYPLISIKMSEAI